MGNALQRVIDWVEIYLQLGWRLCWLNYKEKGPLYKGWQNNPIDNLDKAREIWQFDPRKGVGVLLEQSKIVVLDIDELEYCRKLFEELQIDLEELSKTTFAWTGRPERLKLAFQAPENVELTRHSLSWPALDPETGELIYEGKKPKLVTVVEFRGGHGFQDLVPPTIHKDTGKPYQWITPPWTLNNKPAPLPELLLKIWLDWSSWKPRLESLCPWGLPPTPQPTVPKAHSAKDSQSIIAAFNAKHDVHSLLQSHGYIQKRHDRYLHSDSTTNIPGVIIYDNPKGKHIYSHHGSCALNDDKPHDAFDICRILEHGGDWTKALQAAAKELNMDYKPSKPSAKAKVFDIVSGSEIPTPTGWIDELKEGARGGLQKSLSNLSLIFEHAPEWVGVLAHNEFDNQVYKRKKPPYEHGEIGRWLDYDDAEAAIWLNTRFDLEMDPRKINEAVRVVARHHKFHPVRAYLESILWDGTERLDSWLSRYLGAENTSYHKLVGRKWLHAAVARIFEPGCKYDQILILEGKQRIGKSTALSILGGEWFSDGHIDLRNPRDAALAIEKAWIIEIPELIALMNTHEDQAKAFISTQYDLVRRPYARNTEQIARQSVFAGTINRKQYLKDDTGNERYLPVACTKIDTDRLCQDRDQLWAEAVDIYSKKQETFWLKTTPDYVVKEQDDRYVEDDWEPVIERALTNKTNWRVHTDNSGKTITYVTTLDLLTEVLQIKLGFIAHKDQRRVASILHRLGFVSQRIRTRESRERIYCKSDS